MHSSPGCTRTAPNLAEATSDLTTGRLRTQQPGPPSIGNNAQDCYDVLAATGRRSWHPEYDATLWVKFNLRAHHMQAQTMRRRFDDAVAQWR